MRLIEGERTHIRIHRHSHHQCGSDTKSVGRVKFAQLTPTHNLSEGETEHVGQYDYISRWVSCRMMCLVSVPYDRFLQRPYTREEHEEGE